MPLPDPVQKGDVASVPMPPDQAFTEEELWIKYVDDLTMAEVVDLKTLTKSVDLIGPRNLHDVNGLKLPPEKSKI